MRRFEVSEGSREVGVEGLKGILLLSKVPGISEGPCDMLRQPKSSTDQKILKSLIVSFQKSRLKSYLVAVSVRGKVVEKLCLPHRWKKDRNL